MSFQCTHVGIDCFVGKVHCHIVILVGIPGIKKNCLVNILDININKCKDLLKRLENTSFGVLGKLNIKPDFDSKQEEHFDKKIYPDTIDEIKTIDHHIPQEKHDSYKEKYFALKEEYSHLEDDFQELKLAVDKLFSNVEVDE